MVTALILIIAAFVFIFAIDRSMKTYAADKERYGTPTARLRRLFWGFFLIQDFVLQFLPEDEAERFLCPFCTETIESEAQSCPHCHRDLTDHESIKFAEEDGGLTNWEYNGVVISKRGQDYYIADDPQGYTRLDIAKSVIDSPPAD